VTQEWAEEGVERMSIAAGEIERIVPVLTWQAGGNRWTAASPPGAPIRIATWGETEERAAEEFRLALKRWARILESEE
jgi:hypothetical protein